MKRKNKEGKDMGATAPKLYVIGNPSKIKTTKKKTDPYKAVPFHGMSEKDRRESMESMRDDD
ncbi:hypothetical protein PaeBR_10190 [Paenibacillus sp. BR2-3]|uniref:hypothetical protein n=1 Tax=Paenibacillus sp. BR2-3 TaxID=3048494 RepID=UPI0039778995